MTDTEATKATGSAPETAAAEPPAETTAAPPAGTSAAPPAEAAATSSAEAPAAPAPGPAAADVLDDDDSAYGDDRASSTASVSASILEYRRLHGRTFQNFNTGTEYWEPNDERQNESLDILHHVAYLVFDGKLTPAPIPENVQRVLDVGTGTGIWAIDFADEHPEAEVIGTDLSPIQPSWVPPNCKFELDDAQLQWTYPENHFDFVHLRYMIGAIGDWKELYRQAYRCLKPGGYIEHLDYSVYAQCDDDSMPEDCIWRGWGPLFAGAGEKFGRTFHVIEDGNNIQWMKEVGFVDTDYTDIKIPVGGWSNDPKHKEAGQFYALSMEEGIEGYVLFLLSEIEKWDYVEIQAYLAKARKTIRDKSVHAYFNGRSVWARKPLDA